MVSKVYKDAIELLLLNCMSYFLLTVDFRSVAQANMTWAVSVNIVIAALSFSIFKRMQSAHTWQDRVAYIISGALGVVAGIKLTQFFFGH